MRFPTTILVALTVATGASTAHATPIDPSAFGALATVESFEGLAPGPNIALGLGQSLLEPGTVSAFDFGSGVQLVGPVPNPGFADSGAFVHDFALGNDVHNNWGSGRVVNGAASVPFGSAYLGAFHPSTGTAAITLRFDALQDRVGAYVSGLAGSTVRLDVYGDGGALLESLTIGTVALGAWAGNFLGIEHLAGIRTVVFSGQDFGLDALTFEPSLLAVPEPGTFSAVLLGVVGLVGLAMAGRRPAGPLPTLRSAP